MNRIVIPLAALLLFSCRNAHNSDVPATANQATVPTTDISQIIRNGIHVQSDGGLKIKQAFMLRSNGSLLPEDNKIKVGEIVELRILAEGWQGDTTQKLALGASEKIVTNDGTVAIDETDVFKNQAAIPVAKADLIRLQAIVTKQEKKYDYYKVDFKVWNKGGNQSLTGTYKLYVE